MIGARDEPGVAILRAAKPSDAAAVQAVWETSTTYDDPGDWFKSASSLAGWSTQSLVLVRDGRILGVVGLLAEPAPDGAMPVRAALELDSRQPQLAGLLMQGGITLVGEGGGGLVRLFVPSGAEWMKAAAGEAGFHRVRTIAHMLLPAEAPSPSVGIPPDVRVRSIRADEDDDVLAALNRAWAGTWNFVPIRPEMLADDLRGQREGMLLGVDSTDRIIATCHAVFDPHEQNPDGNPRAWISNVTVDPDHRRRGLARGMLAAGIAYLRACGAGPITLGVDADDPGPFALYQSVGFRIGSTLEAWDTAAS